VSDDRPEPGRLLPLTPANADHTRSYGIAWFANFPVQQAIGVRGGEGFISVVQQNDPNHYALSANISTTVGVRTGIFFGTSLYVGVPAAGLEPAQIWNYGVPE
jgi:hypothetical protein